MLFNKYISGIATLVMIVIFTDLVQAQDVRFLALGDQSSSGYVHAIDQDGNDLGRIFDLSLGASPENTQLTIVGDKMWGTTFYLGPFRGGAIFNYSPGTGRLTKIHDFKEETGVNSYGSLTYYEDRLWGMTALGGTNNAGVIFSIHRNGRDYQVHHHFDAGSGIGPRGDLTILDGKFYGAGSSGGDYNRGTLFTLDLDGTNFQKIHDFGELDEYGRNPRGRLVPYNGRYYALTERGGANGLGTIYSILPNGTDYQVEYSFTDVEGGVPRNSLLLDGNMFYGSVPQGGTLNNGSVYSFDPETDEFSMLHQFNDLNGGFPHASLIMYEERLWGVCASGGEKTSGTIYSIETDGSGFSNLFHFDQTIRVPFGALTVYDEKLYGLTKFGRFSGLQDHGVVYAFDPVSMEIDFEIFSHYYGSDPTHGMTIIQNRIVGYCFTGGRRNDGTIYSANLDGTDIRLVHSFNISDGRPNTIPSEYNDYLIGTTALSAQGSLYQLRQDGRSFEVIYRFENEPFGGVVIIGESAYGITLGGDNDLGLIYSFNLETSTYSKLYDFTTSDASSPEEGMVSVGNVLYGVSSAGGTNGFGTVFKFNTDTEIFEAIHQFDQTNGSGPFGKLLEYDSKLWGVTNAGGINGQGVLFHIDLSDDSFTKSFDFVSAPPTSQLMVALDTLWGFTDTEIFGIDPGNLGTKFSTIGTSDLNQPTIAPLAIAVKNSQELYLDNEVKAYGDNTFNLNTYSNTDNAVTYLSSNPSVIAVNDSTMQIVGSGLTEITAIQTGDDSFYPETATTTIAVEKAILEVQPEDKSIVYGSEVGAIALLYTGFVYDDTETDITPPVPVVSYEDVGTYPIILTEGAAENYDFQFSEGLLTVNKTSLMASSLDKNKVYGDPNPELPLVIEGFKLDDTINDLDVLPTVTTAAVTESPAGSYAIITSGGEDHNYEFVYEEANLDILPRALTIFVKDTTKIYGQPSPEYAISAVGLLPTDQLSALDLPVVQDPTDMTTPVGSYLITLEGGNEENYQYEVVPGILYIKKAPLEVTVDDASRFYGEVNPDFELLFNGFANDDDQGVLDELPAITTLASEETNAGTYLLQARGGNDNNYYFEFVDGLLTIEKATQVVTFTPLPAEVFLSDESINLEAASSSGLPVSYHLSNADLAYLSNDLLTLLAAGSLTITAKQVGNPNYLAADDVSQDITIVSDVPLSAANPDQGITFFPNPARYEIRFENLPSNVSEIFIYDTQGRVVKQSRSKDRMDISGLGTGVYILKIEASDQLILNAKFKKE